MSLSLQVVLLFATLLMVVVVPVDAAEAAPSWTLSSHPLIPSDGNDSRRCLAVVRPHAAAPAFLVPVVVIYTEGMADMAANLAESMISSSSSAGTASVTQPCFHFSRSDSVAAGEAGFGSAHYYDALHAKLQLFTKLILQRSKATASLREKSGSVLPVLAFLDADVQVFPGWFDIIHTSLFGRRPIGGVSDVEAELRKQRRGEALVALPQQDNLLGSDGRPGHGIYFQRESRKKINSGVMALHAGNPAVVELFVTANATFVRKAYGDQTSLQRAIRKLSSSSSSSTSSTPFCEDGAQRSPCAPRLSTGVFNRSLVNAGLIEPQRQSLLIHHAHMSGKYKRANLKAVLEAKAALGVRVHTGQFLGAEAASALWRDSSCRSLVDGLSRRDAVLALLGCGGGGSGRRDAAAVGTPEGDVAPTSSPLAASEERTGVGLLTTEASASAPDSSGYTGARGDDGVGAMWGPLLLVVPSGALLLHWCRRRAAPFPR